MAAYRAALAIEKDLAGDPEFGRLMGQVSVETSVDTEPQGATVSVKPYDAPDAPWELVGVTPVPRYIAPAAPVRFKVEKSGYETLLRALFPGKNDPKGGFGPGSIKWSLDEEGTTPAGMVWIDGTSDLPRFLIDQREVTNREFKSFLDAGGYRDRQFWKESFVKDDKVLWWEAAVQEFVDRTGQPGPSTWEAGVYLEGQDEYPVTGVSWYEAAAYASFVGKELPSVRHWQAAAVTPAASLSGNVGTRQVISLSNFSGKGPIAVASAPNTTRFEVFDLAGNAREWCRNEYGVGRAIRGGAWDDHTYMFGYLTQAHAFDRSERNGFRCVRLPDRGRVPANAFARVPLPQAVRDLSKERPVPDAVFAAYRQQYSYDPIPLDARIETSVAGDDWVRQRVSFTAAYAGQRVIAQVFLPARARPP